MNINSSYEQDGYFIGKTNLSGILSELRNKFVSVFDKAALAHDLLPVRTDQDIIRLYKERKSVWVSAYDQLRYLCGIMGLANNEVLLDLIKKSGIRSPVFCARPIVRADIPYDEKWDFPPHQDYVYNQGSLNSITIWIPFQDVTLELGPLEAIPGSHLQGNVESENGLIKNTDITKYKKITMKLGEVLVFSQFLHHRSGKNTSNQVRFSLQLRFNDLDSEEWASRNYYLNQTINEKSRHVNFKTYFPLTKKIESK